MQNTPSYEKKQVEKSNYDFSNYVGKPRWSSTWHQLDELIQLQLDRTLEIGPGSGILKAVAALFGADVDTLDLDPDLQLDYVGSATDSPFPSNSFDVVCAFPVLEHLPYDTAMQAYQEMLRVSRGRVLISLSDAKLVWRYLLYLLKLGPFDFLISRPFAFSRKHLFDGQHYSEINTRRFLLSKAIEDLSAPG